MVETTVPDRPSTALSFSLRTCVVEEEPSDSSFPSNPKRYLGAVSPKLPLKPNSSSGLVPILPS